MTFTERIENIKKHFAQKTALRLGLPTSEDNDAWEKYYELVVSGKKPYPEFNEYYFLNNPYYRQLIILKILSTPETNEQLRTIMAKLVSEVGVWNLSEYREFWQLLYGPQNVSGWMPDWWDIAKGSVVVGSLLIGGWAVATGRIALGAIASGAVKLLGTTISAIKAHGVIASVAVGAAAFFAVDAVTSKLQGHTPEIKKLYDTAKSIGSTTVTATKSIISSTGSAVAKTMDFVPIALAIGFLLYLNNSTRRS